MIITTPSSQAKGGSLQRKHMGSVGARAVKWKATLVASSLTRTHLITALPRLFHAVDALLPTHVYPHIPQLGCGLDSCLILSAQHISRPKPIGSATQ